jgi:hypothetical protein
VDPDLAAELVERRWFAALGVVKKFKAECDVLLEVLQLAERAWRNASVQLAQVEALRDALEDQLAAMDEPRARPCGAAVAYRVMSAA